MGMEADVGKLLTAKGFTLAVAESTTGGLLASAITDVSGSSTYFIGGVVAYANQVKTEVLGVPSELISSHGAVSREVALSMAQGVRRLLGTDVAISTTGIAGPTGATPNKPLGLTYVAMVADGHEECQEFCWQGTRQQNKSRTVYSALALLYAYLTNDQGMT